MTIMRATSTRSPLRLAAALTLTLVALAGCGSADTADDAAVDDPAVDDAAAAVDDAAVSDDAAPPAETGGSDEGVEVVEGVECDTSTFVYEAFTEIPAGWSEGFPRPEMLDDIEGDVGNGCERVTVDMRGRHTGDARDWMAAYGDRLSDAGFELSDETDELGQVLRTYRSGEDVINFGGDIERPDLPEEYITVGISLTDFPD